MSVAVAKLDREYQRRAQLLRDRVAARKSAPFPAPGYRLADATWRADHGPDCTCFEHVLARGPEKRGFPGRSRR